MSEDSDGEPNLLRVWGTAATVFHDEETAAFLHEERHMQLWMERTDLGIKIDRSGSGCYGRSDARSRLQASPPCACRGALAALLAAQPFLAGFLGSIAAMRSPVAGPAQPRPDIPAAAAMT